MSVQAKGKVTRHGDGRVNCNVICQIHTAAVGGCVLQPIPICDGGECGGNLSIVFAHILMRFTADAVGMGIRRKGRGWNHHRNHN